MAETPTERHNRLAGEHVKALGRAVIEGGGNDAELMVVIESLVLGALILNERAFGVSRRGSVERLEGMAERVCERLAKQEPHHG